MLSAALAALGAVLCVQSVSDYPGFVYIVPATTAYAIIRSATEESRAADPAETTRDARC